MTISPHHQPLKHCQCLLARLPRRSLASAGYDIVLRVRRHNPRNAMAAWTLGVVAVCVEPGVCTLTSLCLVAGSISAAIRLHAATTGCTILVLIPVESSRPDSDLSPPLGVESSRWERDKLASSMIALWRVQTASSISKSSISLDTLEICF